MEWKEVTLGEITNLVIDYRGKTPLKLGSSWSDSGYRALSAKNIKTGQIVAEDSIRFVDEELYRKWMKDEVKKGDILITSEAPFGQIYYWDSDEKIVLSQRLFDVRLNDEVCHKYVYYFMTSHRYQKDLEGRATGTTVTGLRQPELLKSTILLPPLSAQRSIASILSSLDRKIELNNKINADLEEMAQAIFKNWFVDFEPFKNGKFVDSELGMIPEGWKVISLSEIMKYNGGSQPPASEFIDTYQEGYIRFIQIRDYDNDSHITYIPISKRNKLCDELDIMIARYGAALGRICWGLKGAYNVALAKVTPIKSYYREYLRCYLNTSYFYQSINNKGARCAQSGFNQSDINSYMIAFPIDETVVMNFNDLCSSIMDKRLSLKYENSRLSLLRDTLLPRLMSGELEVPE